MYKKIIVIIIAIILILTGRQLFIRDYAESVGDKPIEVRKPTTIYEEYPQMDYRGYTMVPIRILSGLINADVTIDNGTNSVVLTKDNNVISFDLSFPVIRVNNNHYKTGVLPRIYKDDIYVPLRYIKNTLEFEIHTYTLNDAEKHTNEQNTLLNDTFGYEIIVKELLSKGAIYVKGVLYVDKQISIPADYVAEQVDIDRVQYAFDTMKQEASKEGHNLKILSWVRDYERQEEIYNSYLKRDGFEEAESKSAQPGHSEHQTGLAIDINYISDSFGETPEGKWVNENCHKYGFILRYPRGKSEITGYKYEPWHLRYVGVEIANEIYNSGVTLEEYLGIK